MQDCARTWAAESGAYRLASPQCVAPPYFGPSVQHPDFRHCEYLASQPGPRASQIDFQAEQDDACAKRSGAAGVGAGLSWAIALVVKSSTEASTNEIFCMSISLKHIVLDRLRTDCCRVQGRGAQVIHNDRADAKVEVLRQAAAPLSPRLRHHHPHPTPAPRMMSAPSFMISRRMPEVLASRHV